MTTEIATSKNGRTYKRAVRAQRTAQQRVHYAVLSRKLTKPTACEDCGKGGRLHGHHHDYAKPLDVKWLCPLCHARAHKAAK